jgi:DNA-binding response OmpR family regulator
MANSSNTRATAIGEHATSRIERLLVVDDEPEIARIIERVAEQLGFQVQSLSDSMRFEAQLQGFNPSIIFLDINMPGRDGLELIACLAASNYQGRVVIMSGYDPRYMHMSSTIGTARNLAIAATLGKPFRRQQVVELLTRFSTATN